MVVENDSQLHHFSVFTFQEFREAFKRTCTWTLTHQAKQTHQVHQTHQNHNTQETNKTYGTNKTNETNKNEEKKVKINELVASIKNLEKLNTSNKS